MADARNALTSRDSHIWTLRIALVFCVVIILILLQVINARQSDVRVHVPPDLSRGAVLEPDKLQKPNAYAFASYVWRGLNDWTNLGKTDYSARIDRMVKECLVTPDFERWLRNNLREKNRQGELDRTRSLVDEQFYAETLVTPLGVNVMQVGLTLRLMERIQNMPIKDVAMNYTLRVVPDNRPCNAMGMALDGFTLDPSRAEREAEENSRRSRAGKN